MSLCSEVERALLQALARRDDRKRAEHTLETLRRKENDAVELAAPRGMGSAQRTDIRTAPAVSDRWRFSGASPLKGCCNYAHEGSSSS